MKESVKIPQLHELAAIEPAASSIAEDQLTYGNLDSALAAQRGFEYPRYDKLYATAEGSVQEEDKARALARLYMVMSAQRISDASSDASKELWTNRFTQGAVELYGQPEVEVAKSISSKRTHDLITRAEDSGVDSQLVEHFRNMTDGLDFDISIDRNERVDYRETARKVGEYITDRYADVFETLGFDDRTDPIDAEEFSRAVERGFQVLASSHDEDWKDWTVEREPDLKRLVTYAKLQKLVVGADRRPLAPSKAKGLFAHEILVHGLRGVNGKKVSDSLLRGLPGYTEADEGLGVFMDYAVTGSMPEVIADKYTDIALALGVVDGRMWPRKDMIELVSTRMLIQNELKDIDEKETEGDVMSRALSHVNRIYRGTLGNEFVGVFTKDIAYFKGFISMADYIHTEIQNGKSVAEVIDYLMQGKFDPTKESHVAELERLKHEK